MPTDVFLSYARAESTELARDLYKRLTGAGRTVWWDLECMPSRSLTFLQEIRLAIRDAARTVVIVDKPARESEYVQAEWQYALAAGKPVVPLLRTGSYDDLPSELAPLHCPDFHSERPLDEAVRELLQKLSDSPAPLGDLLGAVPDVPPNYQPRPDMFNRLAANVKLGRTDLTTVTGSQRITVLHGMGGSGKSVLAAALARSTGTRQAFGGGIFWLSPSLKTRSDELLRTLGGHLARMPQRWQSLDQCVDGIAKLLAGRAVLIVVDNAASVNVIEPLIRTLDLDSRVVVTTRLGGLAGDLGAGSLPLDELKPREALRLLAAWVERDPEELPPEAAEVARQCGYLPFALAINGSMVRRGSSWSALLRALQRHDLEFARAFERLPGYEYVDVLRAIRPSILQLKRTAPKSLKRLTELAAFHWEEGVAESAVTRFWLARGCPTADDAEQILVDLASRSLVRLEGEAPRRRVRVHDLQLDYLIAAGADARSLARALLRAHGADPAADFPSASADGYFHQHVVRHLIELGELADLERLIDSTTSDGGNAWFQSTEAADNVGGYLDDLDRATPAWPKEAGATKRGAVSAEVHHALIRASINSMSSSLSTEIRTAMLRTKLWSSSRALVEARQVADVDARIRALLDTAPHLETADRITAVEQALELTRARVNQEVPHHLVGIARLDPKRKRALLDEACSFAKTIRLPGDRATAFAVLAEVWDAETRDEVIAEALDAAEEEVNTAGVNQGGFDSFSILAPLVAQDLMPRLFDLIRRIPNDFGKAMAFARAVPHVRDPVERTRLAREGIDIQRSIEGNAVWIGIALTVHLPEFDPDAFFNEIVRRDDRQVWYFISLLPEMTTEDAGRWLARLRSVTFGDEESRFQALFEISKRIGDPDRQRVIGELAALAQTLPHDRWRRGAHDRLAPLLDARQLASALRVLRTIGDECAIGNALVPLLQRIDPAVAAQAVDFVQTRVDAGKSLDVVVAAAAALEGTPWRQGMVDAALEAWRSGASLGGGLGYSLETETLARLARMAGVPDRLEVLQRFVNEIAQAFPGTARAAERLSTIAEFLQPDFVDRLAAHLAERAIDETLHGKVESIRGTEIGRPEVLASTFRALARLLTAERTAALLTVADDVPDEGWRMAARVAVAAKLPEPTRSEVVRDSIAVAKGLDLRTPDSSRNLWSPLLWLAELAPLEERAAVQALALDAARAVDDSSRSRALAAVADTLEGSLRDIIVEEALALGDPYSVPRLLPRLPKDRAIEVAREAAVSTVAWSPYVSSEVAATLAAAEPVERERVWRQLAAELRSLKRGDLVARYAAVLPVLTSVGGQATVDDLARSLIAVANWWR